MSSTMTVTLEGSGLVLTDTPVGIVRSMQVLEFEDSPELKQYVHKVCNRLEDVAGLQIIVQHEDDEELMCEHFLLRLMTLKLIRSGGDQSPPPRKP